jgi:hypothetical protein
MKATDITRRLCLVTAAAAVAALVIAPLAVSPGGGIDVASASPKKKSSKKKSSKKKSKKKSSTFGRQNDPGKTVEYDDQSTPRAFPGLSGEESHDAESAMRAVDPHLQPTQAQPGNW